MLTRLRRLGQLERRRFQLDRDGGWVIVTVAPKMKYESEQTVRRQTAEGEIEQDKRERADPDGGK